MPPHSPASVLLQPAEGDTGHPCGVDYELKAFVGDNSEDKPQKRNLVRLKIRKIMYAPSKLGEQPSVEVSKEFMMKPNKMHLEASLDKDVSVKTFDYIQSNKFLIPLALPSWRMYSSQCACHEQFEQDCQEN